MLQGLTHDPMVLDHGPWGEFLAQAGAMKPLDVHRSQLRKETTTEVRRDVLVDRDAVASKCRGRHADRSVVREPAGQVLSERELGWLNVDPAVAGAQEVC